MTWEHRGELRADPGSAPGERNITTRPRRSSIWPSIAVVAAAAAFGGVIWFAYRNGRDAADQGQPPLVKAEAGSIKVKPDQPGGQDIPFQDSTVYDRLDKGDQKQPVERILPPPETPAERPPPPTDMAASTGSLAPGQPQPRVLPDAPALPEAPPPNDSSPTALAPPPGALTTPPATPPKSPPAAVQPAVQPPAVEAKPTSIAALESRALAGFAAPPPAIKPGPVHKGGGYRVQLSAVRSEDAVQPEWARLKRRFPELGGLSLVTSKAEVPGKGTFYRLRAGPLDEAGAKDTCDRLRAQKLDCIVVKP